MPAPLTLFNSLTRSLEVFSPIEAGKARVYSCGPTVYDYAHLGNLRAYVFTDTLRRVLAWKGYAVDHVINITDVGHLTSDADAGDDKMEAAANRAARTIWEVAAFYTEAFKSDLKALNILDPTRWSVATDHIADMIAFARRLEAGGHTYALPSGLYFDTTTVPAYGALAGSKPDDVIGRIAEVEGKRHAADFALWRASPAGERRQMEWASPWGAGAPGWHLECSVMSLKYLGPQFDIHTGGIDHREIHHPNEIAQNQGYTGGSCGNGTGANVWMHNNFLVDRGGKMSKSRGGIATLDALVGRGVHPLAYRLLCLSAHYRSELEFSGEAVLAALTRLKRLVMTIEKMRSGAAEARAMPAVADGYRDRIDAAVADDLNTPKLLVVLDDFLADRRIDAIGRAELWKDFDDLLGLKLRDLARADLRTAPSTALITVPAIEARLDARLDARNNKDFAAADAIRNELADAGIEVMDGDPLRWEWRVSL